MSQVTQAPTRAFPTGPPTVRESIEAPSFDRVSHTQLAEAASELAKTPIKPGPTALLELSARHPYDALGNIDVYKPARWDTSSNLIFMDSIRQVGESVGEWEGSAAYIEFKPRQMARISSLRTSRVTKRRCT